MLSSIENGDLRMLEQVQGEIAFSMCDSYVMKIEEMKNLLELQPLVEGAKSTFAIMENDLKQREKKGQ